MDYPLIQHIHAVSMTILLSNFPCHNLTIGVRSSLLWPDTMSPVLLCPHHSTSFHLIAQPLCPPHTITEGQIQCRLEEEGEGREGTYRAGETEQEREIQTERARESGRSRERGRDREGCILMYVALCSVHYTGNCHVLFEFTKKLHLETGLHPSLGLNFFMPSVL